MQSIRNTYTKDEIEKVKVGLLLAIVALLIGIFSAQMVNAQAQNQTQEQEILLDNIKHNASVCEDSLTEIKAWGVDKNESKVDIQSLIILPDEKANISKSTLSKSGKTYRLAIQPEQLEKHMEKKKYLSVTFVAFDGPKKIVDPNNQFLIEDCNSRTEEVQSWFSEAGDYISKNIFAFSIFGFFALVIAIILIATSKKN